MARRNLISLGAVVLSLAYLGQAAKDPLNDFCRRWGHQTAVIGRKLYIDGGIVNWNPLPSNPGNYSNTGLLYNDLDTLSPQDGMPQLHANLNKSANVPSVQGGILWEDDVNKAFYLFGGEFQNTPEDFSLWAYDTILDQWNSSSTPTTTKIERVSYGAGTAVNDTGLAYYYGGWLSNRSVPGWTGEGMTTSTLIQYDMVKNKWTNNTGPDNVGRAEGVMVNIPASDGGMLIYFGGISTPYNNETVVGEPMETIRIYDIANSKWYTQNATGQVPEKRRRFCAGVTWANDHTSYNIYLYGGMGMAPNTTGFDDVYILSIPSFTWLKWYPTDPTAPSFPHHSLSCSVIGGSQMIIMGGTFPTSSACDAPSVWGLHNLNLGKDNPTNSSWSFFNPNLTNYKVPAELTEKIGGSAIGGATLQSPALGFSTGDLKTYFSRKAVFNERTPTRAIPLATSASTPLGKPKARHNVGVIVGSSIAGAILALILGLFIFFCVRRARRRGSTRLQSSSPAELPSTTSPMTPYRETTKTFGSSGRTSNAYSSHTSSSPPPATHSPVHDPTARSRSGSAPTGGMSPVYHQPIPGYYHQIPAAQPYYPPPGTQPSAAFLTPLPGQAQGFSPSTNAQLHRWASNSDLHAHQPPNPVLPQPPPVPEKQYELAGVRTPKPEKRVLKPGSTGRARGGSEGGKVKSGGWI